MRLCKTTQALSSPLLQLHATVPLIVFRKIQFGAMLLATALSQTAMAQTPLLPLPTKATQNAALNTPIPSAIPSAIPNAANPSAAVPPVSYRSVFKETSLGVEKDSTDWRKANNEVGQFLRGHVDILKWEEQENAKTMKDNSDKSMVKPAIPKPDTPRPDTPKPATAPAHKH